MRLSKATDRAWDSAKVIAEVNSHPDALRALRRSQDLHLPAGVLWQAFL